MHNNILIMHILFIHYIYIIYIYYIPFINSPYHLTLFPSLSTTTTILSSNSVPALNAIISPYTVLAVGVVLAIIDGDNLDRDVNVDDRILVESISPVLSLIK